MFKLAIVILAVVGMSMACQTRKRRDEFDTFKRQYRKNYATEIEAERRCQIFSDNMDKIESHNVQFSRGLSTYTLGMNKFADLTNEEFLALYTGLNAPSEEERQDDSADVFRADPNFKAPTSVDWSATGHVSPIKNQGQCGSCWSFATNAVLESRYAIKNGKPWQWLDLSEQHFVECSSAYGNQGCNGGLMTNTYDYMLDLNRGAQYESDYPYTSFLGTNVNTCKYNGNKDAVRITGYTKVNNNDNDLAAAIALGTVAVGVNAGGDFQFYQSGNYCPGLIMSGCGWLTLNHAVEAVGYAPDYWKIKNSWGEDWGENGYMRFCRKFNNNCGINRLASFPHIA